MTFRTYLLNVLTTFRRIAGRLGVSSARDRDEGEESHCGKNGFHRWSSMSPHSGVAPIIARSAGACWHRSLNGAIVGPRALIQRKARRRGPD
jgi:hypothetical protein